jgi:hypothetical protein
MAQLYQSHGSTDDARIRLHSGPSEDRSRPSFAYKQYTAKKEQTDQDAIDEDMTAADLTETQFRFQKRFGASRLGDPSADRKPEPAHLVGRAHDIRGGAVTVDWAGMEHNHPRFEVRVTTRDKKSRILWKRFYEFRDLRNQARDPWLGLLTFEFGRGLGRGRWLSNVWLPLPSLSRSDHGPVQDPPHLQPPLPAHLPQEQLGRGVVGR